MRAEDGGGAMSDTGAKDWDGALQRLWRPLFAYELVGECAAMAVLVLHEAWTGDLSTMLALTQFQGFLTWYYGMRFAVLGVFGAGRSVEKVAVVTQGVKPAAVTEMRSCQHAPPETRPLPAARAGTGHPDPTRQS